jgi:hypothetical protein
VLMNSCVSGLRAPPDIVSIAKWDQARRGVHTSTNGQPEPSSGSRFYSSKQDLVDNFCQGPRKCLLSRDGEVEYGPDDCRRI